MNTGDKIKYFRKMAGITQASLSEKTSIPLSSIKQYETGARNPKIEVLQKIAAALDVNVNDLLNFSEVYSIPEPNSAPYDFENDPSKQIITDVVYDLQRLNEKGQLEAAKRVNELTKLDEYTKRR